MDDVVTESMPARGFPLPWIVVEQADGFRIEDASGLAIAWTSFAPAADPGMKTESLTRDEAHRIAKAIAMVPEMRTVIQSLQEGLAEAEDGPEG